MIEPDDEWDVDDSIRAELIEEDRARMTVEEVKAERDRLTDKLQATIAPLIEAFERQTGVVANINTRHLNVTTFEDRVARWKVTVEIALDWEA